MPKEIDLVIPPYPPDFDANARCDYHAGAQGHSTENCKVLTSKVQTLLNSKMLSFTPQGIQINNPLIGHVGSSVYVMEEVVESRGEDDYQTDFSEQF